MPAVYEQPGLRFMYPENWSLDEGEVAAAERSVTVYSPAGAFWSVTRYAPGSSGDDLAAAAVRALKEEYPEAEAEPVSQLVAGQRLSGFDLNFFYLDLTCTALVRVLHAPGGPYVVVCQAEDREFVGLEPVFRAITTSLLQSTP